MQTAIGIFQDGKILKIAELHKENSLIKVKKLKKALIAIGTNKNTGGEFDIDDQITLNAQIDEQSRSTTFIELEDYLSVLSDFDFANGKVGLSAFEEKVSFYNFPDFDDNEIEKIVKTEIMASEDTKEQNYTYTYFRNHDNSALTFIHDGEFELLNKLQQFNSDITSSKIKFSLIDPNEISLINAYRQNYNFEDDRLVMLLYIGSTIKTCVIMQGKKFIKAVPLMVQESTDRNLFRQNVYSKIALANDTGTIPFTKNILVAGDYASDDDISYFSELALSGEVFAKFDLLNHEMLEDSIFSPADFIIPISLARKVLSTDDTSFIQTNLIPKAIIEKQKRFKIEWHGYLMLVILFAVSYFGTVHNLKTIGKLKTQTDKLTIIKSNINDLKKKLPKQPNIEKEKKEIELLRKNLSLSSEIIQDKNQWGNILPELVEFTKNNPITWIHELETVNNSFTIVGFASNRQNVIKLAAVFEEAKIANVEKTYQESELMWKFEISFPYPDANFFSSTNPNITYNKYSRIKLATGNRQVVKKYNEIYKLYKKHKVQKALSLIQGFKKTYASDPLVYLAEYLEGECYFALKQYNKAIKAFNYILKKGGEKTPDAYMMIANSYYNKGDEENASKHWKVLIKKFPKHYLSRIAKRKLTSLGGF